MTKITLYGITASPPTRSTFLTLEVLGLDYKFSPVDMGQGEHLKPEFLKLNPQHTVPTLTDDDFAIFESRAINIYLASAYDSKNILIPACKKKAAKVHQMLYFDACTLGPKFFPPLRARMLEGVKGPLSDDEKKQLAEVLNYLEGYLKPTGFVAGTDSYTLADLCILATYSSLATTGKAFADLDAFPESKKWFEKMKKLVPNYEKACGAGAAVFGNYFKQRTGLL